MKIVFLGTPDIAAECLKALYAAGHTRSVRCTPGGISPLAASRC